MEDFSKWKIPKEVVSIRLDDGNEIKIPYIIENRVLLKEGVANGIFYPSEEIEPTVETLNEELDPDDVEARKRTSIFWDHDDACKNWLGEIKNFRWNPDNKELVGDIYLVDEDAAKKTHYQIQEGLSRWGISPRVRIDEKEGRATNIHFVSFALVLEPAGGPQLMLEETQDKEPYIAWVCKECGYSEAVEKDEKDEKTKECPKCKGDMEQKKEARSSDEELYEDLELEPKEKDSDMEFEDQQFECQCIECGWTTISKEHCDKLKCEKCGGQMRRKTRPGPGKPSPDELKKLAEEFSLSFEEIKRFSSEQLELLQNVPVEIEAEPQKTYKKPPETEAKKMFVCPKCGHLEKIKAGEKEKECSRCRTPMEIKEIKDETEESLRKRFETFAPIVKVNQDEHILKMIILEPEVADNQTHVVSEKEIQNAMYHWMENYRKLEVMHRDKAGNLFPLEERILSPEDEAWRQGWEKEFTILECFQAPTDYFEGDQLVHKGSWIVTLRVNDENIWQKIKNKKLTGASIGGHGALTSEVIE